MKRTNLLISGALLLSAVLPALSVADTRPNIVLIMTDDMGFSDLGCYGGEIDTPNIDRLAERGIKFSQFYNCGKCEPSRAALLTGHQFWTTSPDVAVRKDSPNIGEILQPMGYRTMMLGKWHADGIPYERGFNRHFGFMGGGTDFFNGDKTFTLDGKPWPVPEKDFYVTTALTEYAVKFLREEYKAHPDQPFFLYLAYNAPHSPIEAPEEGVKKFRGKYREGWDVLRKQRFEKQQKLGLAGSGWHLPERPENIPPWGSLDAKSKDFEDLRMATYAAMVNYVDQGVGAVLKTLDEIGVRDNTLVIFLNDNGASPNDRVRRGTFGSLGTTWNVGLGWAQMSNTPFKYYKRTQHSGGVTTPFIASWPKGIKPRKDYEDQPCHITDLIPTVIDLAGGEYPRNFGGKKHPPLPGRSLVPILKENKMLPSRPMYFSLFNNMAVVDNGWRLVTAYNEPWQLYDLTNDRTEIHDLAKSNPEKLAFLLKLQAEYAARDDVKLRLKAGEREPEYAPIYREDGRIGPGANEKVDNEALNMQLVKIRSTGREPDAEEMKALEKKYAGKAGEQKSAKRKAKKAAPKKEGRTEEVVFNERDGDKNGIVTWDEYLGDRTGAQLKLIERSFKRRDKDGDGTWTKDEVEK